MIANFLKKAFESFEKLFIICRPTPPGEVRPSVARKLKAYTKTRPLLAIASTRLVRRVAIAGEFLATHT